MRCHEESYYKTPLFPSRTCIAHGLIEFHLIWFVLQQSVQAGVSARFPEQIIYHIIYHTTTIWNSRVYA